MNPDGGGPLGPGVIAWLLVLPALGPAQDPASSEVPRGHWLIRHQEEDGRWDADGFARRDHEQDPASVSGEADADLRVTALALLCLIDTNSDLTSGTHRTQVARAAEWLVAQHAGPPALAGAAHAAQVRDHALATVALVELLASSPGPELRSTVARWVDGLEFARHPDGGWGAGPELAPDALTTGWALVALRLADRTGLAVSRRALREGEAFQRRCLHVERGLVALRPDQAPTRLAPTALTLLSRALVETPDQDEDWVLRARAALVQAVPARDQEVAWEDVYTATAACYVAGGRWWKDWSKGVAPMLEARLYAKELSPGPHERGGSVAAIGWFGLTASTWYRYARVVVR